MPTRQQLLDHRPARIDIGLVPNRHDDGVRRFQRIEIDQFHAVLWKVILSARRQAAFHSFLHRLDGGGCGAGTTFYALSDLIRMQNILGPTAARQAHSP